jgi:hypothetical protein
MEKRRNTRVTFGVGAVIKYKKQSVKCSVINLSLNGILLKCEKEIPNNAEVKIGIFMEGSTSKLKINVEGVVVRSSTRETAIIFNSIDLDSFIHLKNIVAYNEGNEDKIMQEFYKKVNNCG